MLIFISCEAASKNQDLSSLVCRLLMNFCKISKKSIDSKINALWGKADSSEMPIFA